MWQPKIYFDNGRMVQWGENLAPETVAAMREGEIFTLMRDNKPVLRLLLDSFDTLRESSVVVCQKLAATQAAMFGIPPINAKIRELLNYPVEALNAFEKLPEEYQYALERIGLRFEDFTCAWCSGVAVCDFSFDTCCVDGKCLAEK